MDEKLNNRFGKPGISFLAGHGGLVKCVIDSPLANGEIYLHGAHIAHFQPAGEEPVLWMSEQSYFADGKPIRGGIPLCFPWFASHPTRPDAPGHGLARLTAWDVEATDFDQDGTASIVLFQKIEDFECRLVTMFGNELDVSLEFRLADDAEGEAKYQVALHSYFAIGDIASISITGLEEADYIDKLDQARRKDATGKAIQFDAECDRIYLNTTATCVLHDPVLGRRVRVEKRHSQQTVVWNPWIEKAARMPDFGDEEWQQMVCIETANVGADQTLQPGESSKIATRIGVDH